MYSPTAESPKFGYFLVISILCPFVRDDVRPGSHLAKRFSTKHLLRNVTPPGLDDGL